MSNARTPFADRVAAGRALADELVQQEWHAPIVLALPRGGVPVAYEVAKRLRAPLDLVMVRKLGAPGHEEYAIGAIVDGADPQVVLDRDTVSALQVSDSYIQRSVDNALSEIERRRAKYGAGDMPSLAGRTAILVDDGIATGNTVKAALKGIRQSNPERIVLAVPVAPADSLAALAALCDDVVCLSQPSHFYAVGAHYIDFGQTSDDEVVALLAKARAIAS